LKATRDRPLFSTTRRPPPTIAVAAPPPPPTVIADAVEPPEPPPFTLLGTLIGPKDRTAIVVTDGAKAANRLHEGEVVSGWRLVSINPRSAAVIRDGRTVRLELGKATGALSSSMEDANAGDTKASDGLAADAMPADPEPRPSVITKLRRFIR
jgi:general secretion pathway protein N